MQTLAPFKDIILFLWNHGYSCSAENGLDHLQSHKDLRLTAHSVTNIFNVFVASLIFLFVKHETNSRVDTIEHYLKFSLLFSRASVQFPIEFLGAVDERRLDILVDTKANENHFQYILTPFIPHSLQK